MANKSSAETVALTSVPLMLTSDGQLTSFLDLGSLTTDANAALKPITETNDTSYGGNLLFQISGSTNDMLSSTISDKPAMTLLQPVDAFSSTTCATSSVMLSGTPSVLVSHDILHDSGLLNLKTSVPMPSLKENRMASEFHDGTSVYNTRSLLSGVRHQSLQPDRMLNSEQCEEVQPMTAVCSTSVPMVLKQDSDSVGATQQLVFTEQGEGLETDSSADKSLVSPSSIIPDGAVLIETSQGLMLSVGSELRAVTLSEGPDAQGNHFLSISNTGIPVALLSQQGGLIDEQSGGEGYDGAGDGDIGLEEPANLFSQPALTVSSPDDDEPRKKNRGWPKGKKRKNTAEAPGPKAPMTGYVIYALERRPEIRQSHPNLPFTEVTKMLGHEWSTMSLEKKQKYLDEADNEKQRYIDELKDFQKSEAYQSMMKRKRYKSDDGNDEDLEEEGDELHCKVCKTYFSSLHNKKEHLLGRQHLNAVKDHLKNEIKRQQKEQEEELRGDSLVSMDLQLGGLGDTTPMLTSATSEPDRECEKCSQEKNQPVDINSFIDDFVHKNAEREQEILALKHLYQRDLQENWNMCKQIETLKDYEYKLRQEVKHETSQSAVLSGRINMLKMVPTLFGVDL